MVKKMIRKKIEVVKRQELHERKGREMKIELHCLVVKQIYAACFCFKHVVAPETRPAGFAVKVPVPQHGVMDVYAGKVYSIDPFDAVADLVGERLSTVADLPTFAEVTDDKTCVDGVHLDELVVQLGDGLDTG